MASWFIVFGRILHIISQFSGLEFWPHTCTQPTQPFKSIPWLSASSDPMTSTVLFLATVEKKLKRDHGDHGRHEELVPKLHQDSQHISRLAVTTLLQPALPRSPLIIPNLSTHSLLGGRITFRWTVFSRTAITTPSQSWANSAFHAALVELLTFDRELDPGAQVIQNLLALQYSTGRLTIMKTT